METQPWSPPGGAGKRNGEGETELKPPAIPNTHPFCPYVLLLAQAAVTAPTMPPMMPGMPCRLWIPHVSWIRRWDSRNGWRGAMGAAQASGCGFSSPLPPP